MTDAAEFARRVRAGAAGTPYVVHETAEGFDVTLDIADDQWFGLFNKAGLRRVYVHHVALPEPGVYTVTDDYHTLDWVAGTPRLSATAERMHGRVRQVGGHRVWAFDAQGRFGTQSDFRFDSEEGRRLVSGVARQLGLTRKRGVAENVGLAFAVLAVVGVLGVGLLMGTLALLGRL